MQKKIILPPPSGKNEETFVERKNREAEEQVETLPEEQKQKIYAAREARGTDIKALVERKKINEGWAK